MHLLPVRAFRWWYVPLGLAIFIFLQIAMGAVLDVFSLSDGATRLLGSVATLVTFVASALAIPAVFGQLTRKDLGLDVLRWRRIALIGVALYGALFVIVAVWSQMGDNAESQDQVINALGVGENVAGDLGILLAVTIFAAIGEELFFRGLLYRAVRDGLTHWIPLKLTIPVALLLSSYFFASAHGGEGQDQQIWILAVHGLVWALAYELTGSLLTPILMHTVNNSVSIWIGFMGASSVTLSAPWLSWLIPMAPLIVLVLVLGLRALLPRD